MSLCKIINLFQDVVTNFPKSVSYCESLGVLKIMRMRIQDPLQFF